MFGGNKPMNFLPWKLATVPENIDLKNYNNMPNFFKNTLAGRGITSSPESLDYTQLLSMLHNPMDMKDMDVAVQRIQKAINQGEKILVYGDYDCDGIISTVILYHYLESEGADVIYYIPERDGEGYGLNKNSISTIKNAEIDLIITVDNGITAVDEIAFACEQGLDVIITDHHQPLDVLPKCTAILNPHRSDCTYPFENLCGAGVAFKLITALDNDLDGNLVEQYADLVAIATVGDIVPLNGENKTLVSLGISLLKDCQRPSLIALAGVAGIDLLFTTSEHIAFGIVPRINATGRIGAVDLAVELLLSTDMQDCQSLADQITALNMQRKSIEQDITNSVDELISKNPHLLNSRVLVVAGEDDWHHGVIGITCAKMVEKYRKPCIICSKTTSGELRGSARSIEGFSIIKAIDYAGKHLLKYGGHPMAAGLSLDSSKLDDFKNALEEYSKENYQTMPVMTMTVDSTLEIKEINVPNIKLLDTIEPFGCANDRPVYLLKGVTLTNITPIGNNRHLRLSVKQFGSSHDLLMFNTAPENFKIPLNTLLDCVISTSINVYKETESSSARVLTLAPSNFPMDNKLTALWQYQLFKMDEEMDTEFLSDQSFSREAIIPVFQTIRKQGKFSGGLDQLYTLLPENFSYFNMLVAVDIFIELGLMTKTQSDKHITLEIAPPTEKRDIATAPTFMAINLLLTK